MFLCRRRLDGSFVRVLVLLAALASFVSVAAEKQAPVCDAHQVNTIRPELLTTLNDSTDPDTGCPIVKITGLEICESSNEANRTWKKLCDYNITDSDASVICNELGYSDQDAKKELTTQVIGGSSSRYYLGCSGHETNVSQCLRMNSSVNMCEAIKVVIMCMDVSSHMCSGEQATSTKSRDKSTTLVSLTVTTTPYNSTSSDSQTEPFTTQRSTEDTSSSSTLLTVVVSAGVGAGVLAFLLLLIVIVALCCMCICRRTIRKEQRVQVSPDSPAKLRRTANTNSKDIESGIYAELNTNTTDNPTSQTLPIYDSVKVGGVSTSQNPSEMSASDQSGNPETPFYAALNTEATYTQIPPFIGNTAGNSNTLPLASANDTTVQPSYYQKLDHSLSLPRQTGANKAFVPNAVNRTALAFDAGNFDENDIASPTDNDHSVNYPSPHNSPKQSHSSHSSVRSRETNNTTESEGCESWYHMLDPIASQERTEICDMDSQVSTDAVVSHVMSGQMLNNYHDCLESSPQTTPPSVPAFGNRSSPPHRMTHHKKLSNSLTRDVRPPGAEYRHKSYSNSLTRDVRPPGAGYKMSGSPQLIRRSPNTNSNSAVMRTNNQVLTNNSSEQKEMNTLV